MSSFFKCEFAGRTVVVWPTITGESGFYDVVISDGGPLEDRLQDIAAGESSDRTLTRVTAGESASVILTELGTPLATTLASVEGMIRRWRAEFDAEVREPVR